MFCFSLSIFLSILFVQSAANAVPDVFCKTSPDWWRCSLGFAITNPTPSIYFIEGTQVVGTLYDNKCNTLDQQPIIGDYSIVKNFSANALTTTLHGPDPQANWNVTIKMALPTAAELICTNITLLPWYNHAPPPYLFGGCENLMPISAGCDTHRYQKHIDQPFGALTTAACGLQPGLAVIEVHDRWGNVMEAFASNIVAGIERLASDGCECTFGGSCTLAKQGGFCCRCPVQCMSEYFY